MQTIVRNVLLASSSVLVSSLVLTCLVHAQTLQPFQPLNGPHQVGRIDEVVTDRARLEIFTETPEDQRQVLVSIYYPANIAADATPQRYMSEQLATALKAPQQFLEQTTAIHDDAPIVDGRFPLLLFSPAFGTTTNYYSSLLSQLASEGYIVAALWHPYSTNVVLLPDGTELRRNDAGTVNGDTLEEQLASIEHVGNVWVGDIRAVLDQLQQWNTNHVRLRGHIDFDRIAALGHSLGGAAAVEAAYLDERIDAAINMDGTMFGNVTKQGSRVPFLSLTADPPQPTDQQLEEMGITREVYDSEEKVLGDAYERAMAGSAGTSRQQLLKSRHNAFIVDNLFFTSIMRPENKLRAIGEIEPMEAYRQILQWVSDFLARQVKNR